MARLRVGRRTRPQLATSFSEDESERIAAALIKTGETAYKFLQIAALERADRVLAKKE